MSKNTIITSPYSKSHVTKVGVLATPETFHALHKKKASSLDNEAEKSILRAVEDITLNNS